MAASHRSRVVRVASRLLPPLAAALLACSDGSDAPPPPPDPTTPPVISGLDVWPDVVAVAEGGGMASVSYGVGVSDADSDVARVVATVLDASQATVSQSTLQVENPPGATIGTLFGQVAVPTAAAGAYTIELQAFDRADAGSNVLRHGVSVVPGNPAPTIAALSPESVPAGSNTFMLTVTGTGFVPGSSVRWNGTTLSTTYVDATTLRAQVASYLAYSVGTAQITVHNPAPGGGTSAAAVLVVEPPPPNPVPTLTSMSPTSVDAGGPSFTLTVTGSGFVTSSRILWNGNYVSTTFVDASTLTGSLSSWEISTPRTATITVSNPAPGGGTSSPLTFTVTRPEVPGLTLVGLKGNDLAWDPYQRKIYVSVPSGSPVNPNTVTVLDPFTGELTDSQFVGSEPERLALSDDGRLLYVSLRGASSVERLTVPGLSRDLSIPMERDPVYGLAYASDLRVAPGSPGTVAVSLSAQGYSSFGGGIVIYDEATPRPTRLGGGGGSSYRYGSLQWGPTASDLYATSASYGYELFTFSVDASGVVLRTAYGNTFSTYGVGVRFEGGTGLLYAEDGRVVDPDTGLLAGTYPSSGYPRRVAPDSSLGAAFFAGAESYSGSSQVTLSAYDLMQYYPARSTTVPFVGAPRQLIRWGADGLAFLTPDSVALLRGPFVLPLSESSNPVPTLGSTSPSSAAAGDPNLVLAVTGSGFVRGSAVLWNGSERATTFVSPTALLAYVPASDVAAAGAAEITVASPGPGGGLSGAATFTVTP